MIKIEEIRARKVLDSAGEWTVEATVELDNGLEASASVPTGVSTSPYESKTVSAGQAVKNINNVVNKAFARPGLANQEGFDKRLVELGIGANASLAVSLAYCRAAAVSSNLPLHQHIAKTFKPQASIFKLPQLMVLLFEGGKHGSGKLVSQEFMAIAKDVNQGLRLYNTVREHLKREGRSLSVGLEGGFTPDFDDTQALEVLNYILGGNPLALDVAFESHRRQDLNYQHFIGNLNLEMIEDPFGVEDWETWQEFNKGWGKEILVVADDLVATNPERLKTAIEKQATNAVVIKPNQIGTLSDTLQVVKLARKANWKVIVSHRGQETNDDFIADLGVAVGADFVKFGGFARGERLAKYNRLLQIQP